VPVAEALTQLGAELGMGDPLQLAAIQRGWTELVGPAVASHARVRSLRDGVLDIAVDAPPWATELRYQAATVRTRAGALLGPDVVREVRVVVEARS